LGPLPPPPPPAAGEIDLSLLRVIGQEVAFGARTPEDGGKAFVTEATAILARARLYDRALHGGRRPGEGARGCGSRGLGPYLATGRARIPVSPAVADRLLWPDHRADDQFALSLVHRFRPVDGSRMGGGRQLYAHVHERPQVRRCHARHLLLC